MPSPAAPTGFGDSGAQIPLFDESALDIADFLRESADDSPTHIAARPRFWALTLGAVGVVYGDIGTSPIYALREALRPLSGDGLARGEVLGLLSLITWTLLLIVTLKYVAFLLRADNRGEGGILSLYTLVRLALGQRSRPVLALAVIGAALFAGDAVITPAISVLSAVEGTTLILPAMADWVVPITLGILVALFAVQARGTATVAGAFGPITALWFITLGGLGLWHIAADPAVLAALNPLWALTLLQGHSALAFAVLGAVFLAVTGAEALYADLGHFGRGPITLAWLALVFPALLLNYYGQGALVLAAPETASDPFFRLAPEAFLPALVALATAATVIASQAVISGAYSMARASIQLGLLPRMTTRHTSAEQGGQIYIPAVNTLLLIGVIWLVVVFDSSSALASAYGISVTGTMVVTSLLAMLYLRKAKGLSLPLVLALGLPILALELAFLASNLTKLTEGGYVPLLLGLLIALCMAAWWRGGQALLTKFRKSHVATESFVRSMSHSSAPIVPGTAFFLTPDPAFVPSALLHNLKHNRVLHQKNVFLTVETLRVPVAHRDERVEWQPLSDRFGRLTLRFGFMETPNIARAMVHARRAGLRFDVMSSSFFLGRRRAVPQGPAGLARLLDNLYALLSRFSADPTDYFHLPRDRVVELGERVAF